MTIPSLTSSTSGSYTSSLANLPPFPSLSRAAAGIHPINRASSVPIPAPIHPLQTLSPLALQVHPISRGSSDPSANRSGMDSTAQRIHECNRLTAFSRSNVTLDPNDGGQHVDLPDDIMRYLSAPQLTLPPRSETPFDQSTVTRDFDGADVVTLPPGLEADLMSRLATPLPQSSLTSGPQALPLSASRLTFPPRSGTPFDQSTVTRDFDGADVVTLSPGIDNFLMGRLASPLSVSSIGNGPQVLPTLNQLSSPMPQEPRSASRQTQPRVTTDQEELNQLIQNLDIGGQPYVRDRQGGDPDTQGQL